MIIDAVNCVRVNCIEKALGKTYMFFVMFECLGMILGHEPEWYFRMSEGE